MTAAFNLNLLTRINRELGGDFDRRAFRHRAFYNAAEGRIEMQLVSRVAPARPRGGSHRDVSAREKASPPNTRTSIASTSSARWRPRRGSSFSAPGRTKRGCSACNTMQRSSADLAAPARATSFAWEAGRGTMPHLAVIELTDVTKRYGGRVRAAGGDLARRSRTVRRAGRAERVGEIDSLAAGARAAHRRKRRGHGGRRPPGPPPQSGACGFVWGT